MPFHNLYLHYYIIAMKVKKIFAAMLSAIAALTGTMSAVAAAPTTVKHPEWSRNAVIYELNWRQMTPGGTIGEAERHLDRLKELGVDIIWLMPVHPISELNRKGGLGSYYAVRDYKAVNPELGSADEFRHFVDQAHARGMKVIIDWVPNHTGCDNAWVTEHPDYYERDKHGNMYGPFDWTDVYKLDYSNPELRAAMIDAMSYWLRDMDIDGFRCDVAMQVPVDFWNECRPALEAVKPGIFMLAEASQPDLEEHAFDMAYNWPMKDLFGAIAATAGQNTFKKDHDLPVKHAVDIDRLLAEQNNEYPADSYMMNMITNHDLNSWEGTEFERLGNLTEAFALLSYTLPGMPLIYTGQEVGMDRAFEFFVKDTPPDWKSGHDFQKMYSRLNAIKHAYPELAAGSRGARMVRYNTRDNGLYVFSRGRVLTMVNLTDHEAPLEYAGDAPVSASGTWRNALTGETVTSLPDKLGVGEGYIFTTN